MATVNSKKELTAGITSFQRKKWSEIMLRLSLNQAFHVNLTLVCRRGNDVSTGDLSDAEWNHFLKVALV